MNVSRRGRAGIVLRGTAALAMTLGISGFCVTGASAAQQIAISVTYRCVFPEIGPENATVQISSNIPDSIAVGQSTAHYVVSASASVP